MQLPLTTQVTTVRLIIRPIRETDLPALLEVNGDETVTRFLPYPTWRGLADGEAWLARMRGLEAGGTAAQYVIEQRDQSRAIGSILLFRIDEKNARAELGYVLARAYWGSGYMHEALAAFVRLCFGEWHLRRLEAEVNPANQASARVLTRLGFQQEGLLRERWIGKDGAYDSAIYGLLRDDVGTPEPQAPGRVR